MRHWSAHKPGGFSTLTDGIDFFSASEGWFSSCYRWRLDWFQKSTYWLVVEPPTHLKKICACQNGFIFPLNMDDNIFVFFDITTLYCCNYKLFFLHFFMGSSYTPWLGKPWCFISCQPNFETIPTVSLNWRTFTPLKTNIGYPKWWALEKVTPIKHGNCWHLCLISWV